MTLHAGLGTLTAKRPDKFFRIVLKSLTVESVLGHRWPMYGKS